MVAEPGLEGRSRVAASFHEASTECRDPLRPRRHNLTGREAELHPPEPCVTLGKCRCVVLGKAAASRKEPRERTIEVGAPYCRASLDDGEPVRREDERRELAAQGLRRGEPCPVELGDLAGAGRKLHAHAVADAGAREVQLHGGRLLAVADQPCVASRSRREALRADMDGLEEARLAGAVLARHEHDPGRELELERSVAAEAPERDGVDDQTSAVSARQADRHDQVRVVG